MIMETLTTQTLAAMNMVEYFQKERLNHIRNPITLALVDQEIAKYEAQVDHLRELRAEMILDVK
jgi:hypothetical protein